MKSRRNFRMSIAVVAIAVVTFSLAVRAQAQTETTLYTFSGGADGGSPSAALISDSAGNFFGVAESGGITTGNCTNNQGCGVVFELSPNGTGGWTETVLHTFTGGADGAFPSTTLLLDTAGNLYGTALSGGSLAVVARTVVESCSSFLRVPAAGPRLSSIPSISQMANVQVP